MRTLYKSVRLIFVIKTNSVTLSSTSCQDFIHSLRKTSNLQGTKPWPCGDWAEADQQQHLTDMTDLSPSCLSLVDLSLSMSPAGRAELIPSHPPVVTTPSALTSSWGERGLTVHCLDYQSISLQRNVNKISSWVLRCGGQFSLNKHWSFKQSEVDVR